MIFGACVKIKAKVKLPLCLNKYRNMKTYREVGLYFNAFVTSVLEGSEWSPSRSGHFTPREQPPVPVG
jgi:hypothetical protein